MYCGNAAGMFLPPMVVYKANNCYTEWTAGGPPGTTYDATPSGWFDGRTFNRWFSKVFVPHVKDHPGTKVIIGDNLSSHFTSSVVNLAQEHDIRFVCLLPNATDLLQPLDVAVFRPLKLEWRKILSDWQKESRVKGSIPKNQFPGLLLRLQNRLKPSNITAGFKASGIWPVDRNAVLKRLPQSRQDTGNTSVSETFNVSIEDILMKHCGPGDKKKQPRGKKFVPGRAIVPGDLAQKTASGTGSGTSVRQPAKQRKKAEVTESESSTSDIEPDTSDESPAVSGVSDDNDENEDCTGAGSSEIQSHPIVV